jgi:hypothetical protein
VEYEETHYARMRGDGEYRVQVEGRELVVGVLGVVVEVGMGRRGSRRPGRPTKRPSLRPSFRPESDKVPGPAVEIRFTKKKHLDRMDWSASHVW